jgi:hypothetical protein
VNVAGLFVFCAWIASGADSVLQQTDAVDRDADDVARS